MRKTSLSSTVNDVILCDETLFVGGGFDVVPAGWDLVQFVDSKLKDCKCFIDIGANVGSFTLLAKGYPNVKFLSFEPVKKTFSILKKNVELNGIQNVTLVNKGLSDKEDSLEIYVPSDTNQLGCSSLYQNFNSEYTKELCEFDKLDNYIEHTADFIKIDVEGHEYNVLNGGLEFLKKHHSTLLIEDNPPQTEEERENQIKIYTLLDSIG